MNPLASIIDLLKLVISNQKAARWVIGIAIAAGIGGFFYLKYRPQKETDCDFVKQQNKELLGFILEARKQVKELAQPTSYIVRHQDFVFASFDTIPKKENKTMKAQMLLSRFDSVLLKVKQDSIQQAKKKAG